MAALPVFDGLILMERAVQPRIERPPIALFPEPAPRYRY
jgi:hypothetical protein